MMKLFSRQKKMERAEAAQQRKTPDSARPKKIGGYLLEVRCRGKRIISTILDDPSKEFSIGKAPDNDLILPETDRSSAQRHAKLRLVQGGVKLTSCGKSGIHFRGEALNEIVLKKNDRASLGDSELFVKPGPNSSRRISDVHRLEVIGGEKDGEIVRLEKNSFRIGSASDNDLVLASDVVSAHHAEIRIAGNGETWLKDMRSSNGTFVNGEQLGRQERMLMDSDEISIACFDYRFLDRNVVHTRTHFGKKMMIMGATILVVLFVFGLFYMVSPTTEAVIGAVDFYLRRHDYGMAEKMLKKMPDSRGFQRYEKQYQEYRVQIPRYRSTWESVLQFQNLLSQSSWDEAATCFGKLGLYEPQAWNQADPETPDEQQKIRHAKELLDTLLALRDMRTSLSTSIADLTDYWEKIKKEMRDSEKNAKKDQAHLNPIQKTFQEQMKELGFDVNSIHEIEDKMTSLAQKGDSKQLIELAESLEKQLQQISGIAKGYAQDIAKMKDAPGNAAGDAEQEQIPEYLKPLHKTLREQMEKVEFDINSICEIEKRMVILAENGDSKQLEELVDFLEKRLHEVSGIVRVYIRELSNSLQIVQSNIKALDENAQALFDLRLDDIRPVTLISSDDCMKMPLLYQLRRKLEHRQTMIFRSRDHWKGLQRQLARYGLEPGFIPEEISLFSDKNRIRKVIADASASKEGIERYDGIFGKRYFYEVLQQTVHSTNNIYASDLIPDMKRIPSCIRLKELYHGVSLTLAWFRLPRNQWLIRGRMKETRDYYQQILDSRKTVLQTLEDIASGERDNRQYFIAKTAWFFFAPARPDVPEKMKAFAAEWRNFRLKQQNRLEQFDFMDEQKTERIRDSIIKNGIPGDPVFNWVRSVK